MVIPGIDLVEVERIRKSLESEAFRRRVYGEREYAALEEKKWNAESAAAWFAAKEAFGKALGTGLCGFSLREVEVLHDGQGKPYFALSGHAAELVRERGLEFSVSLTHTAAYAAAFVVAQTVAG